MSWNSAMPAAACRSAWLKERVQKELNHDPMTFRDIKFLMNLIINCSCGLLCPPFLFYQKSRSRTNLTSIKSWFNRSLSINFVILSLLKFFLLYLEVFFLIALAFDSAHTDQEPFQIVWVGGRVSNEITKNLRFPPLRKMNFVNKFRVEGNAMLLSAREISKHQHALNVTQPWFLALSTSIGKRHSSNKIPDLWTWYTSKFCVRVETRTRIQPRARERTKKELKCKMICSGRERNRIKKTWWFETVNKIKGSLSRTFPLWMLPARI